MSEKKKKRILAIYLYYTIPGICSRKRISVEANPIPSEISTRETTEGGEEGTRIFREVVRERKGEEGRLNITVNRDRCNSDAGAGVTRKHLSRWRDTRRGEARMPSSVKGGEGWREGGGIVDQLEETGDFFGTGRTKLARGCCSRLNPSLTDRLELTFLNDAPPKRGVLLRATMDPAIEEFLLSKDISSL